MSIQIPCHVAIVMDGNGRWAKQHKLPRMAGHQAGAKVVREIVEFAVQKKIQVLTLFAFGRENWRRPEEEVKHLMALFLELLEKNISWLNDNQIRLRIIGDRSSLKQNLLQSMTRAENDTQHNTGMNLVVAFNYSGRWDLVHAMQKIALQLQRDQITIQDICEEKIHRELSIADLPEPDLFIRTSGEQRLSNFMLWQMAYTEIWFSAKYWPDFHADEFAQALQFFDSRQRRFGLTSEQIELSSVET